MIWWYLTSQWMYPAHPLSVQFSSVAQSCPTLCDPMNHSTPGLPVHHKLPKFTQTHVHQVGDAIQPSHPLASPSPPAPNPSQHQGLFQWVKFHMRWPKCWSFSFSISPSSEHPGLISFRMDWFDLLAVQGTFVFSNTTVQKQQFFSAQLSSQPNSHMTTGKTIDLTRKTFVGKVMSLLFNMLSRLVIIFLPRSKCLLISWLQSISALILETQKIKVWHCFHCLPIYFPWGDGTRCHDLSFLNVKL